MLGAVLLLQLATVGDTIWVRRALAAPPDRAVRAAEWRPEGEVEVLGRARIERIGDSVEVAYPVTVWAPGDHVVEVPGPLLVGADGAVDSLPPVRVTLSVASVLPPARPDTGLRPQPPAAPVPLREYSLLPLAWLLGAALLLLAPLHAWWAARGASFRSSAGPRRARCGRWWMRRWSGSATGSRSACRRPTRRSTGKP